MRVNLTEKEVKALISILPKKNRRLVFDDLYAKLRAMEIRFDTERDEFKCHIGRYMDIRGIKKLPTR